MDYAFGDIIDARKVAGLDHFLLILGEIHQGKGKPAGLLFYKISSRFYKVFSNLLSFFNDCIDEDYERFFRHFSKEKKRRPNREHIPIAGRLCDAFFLDQCNQYPLHLDVDSIVILNQDPQIIDKPVVEQHIKTGTANYTSRLSPEDTYKFVDVIKHSPNIGPKLKSELARNFNIWHKKRKS